jgi:heptosyltransferase I
VSIIRASGKLSPTHVPTDLAGKRVALVLLSAIGDVVHGLPLVNSLRAASRGMHLTWIIQPVPHQLVRDHPAVDEFVLFRRELGWRAYQDVWRATRDRRFDLVLDPHVYFKAGVITGLLRAPRKIGFDRARTRDLNLLFTTERIPARPLGHVLEQNLEFLDYLGIPRRLEWGLEATAIEAERYAPLLPLPDRTTVAVVLASSKPEKDWPAERYPLLVQRVQQDLGARVVLVGGLSERENAAARLLPDVLDLRAWDLRRLVYLLGRSNALVSPDTGPLHIGVGLGTPSVALMGYTNPKWMGPARYPELMVDAYADPGEVYTATREYRSGRMERITVEQVLERVRVALTMHR